VVDSRHSVIRPLLGEVVNEDTISKGYSTWGDAHEATSELPLLPAYPTVCPVGQAAVVDKRRFNSDDGTST